MNALAQMVFAHANSVVLMLLSLAAMIGVVVFSVRRNRQVSHKATRLLYLALDGRADEARIQARGEGRELKPVLDALQGELDAPSARPLIRDAISLAVMFMLPVVPILYGLRALMDPNEAAKVAAGTALLIGIAVLLPLTVAGAITIIEISRRSARSIRGACITLLSKSVKSTIDAELSEALRRGANIRDPRGE